MRSGLQKSSEKTRDDLAPTAEDLVFEKGPVSETLGDQGRLGGRVELIAGDDEWVIQGDYLIRVHRFPRMCLFTPLEAEDPPPIPIEKIDVMRATRTDTENR